MGLFTLQNDLKDESFLRLQFLDSNMYVFTSFLGVGHYSDPDELPGLAHFLEHMVFMGSKKFPKENGYAKFVQDNGGSENACTGCEHTTFFFEIQRNCFSEALNMFSQFFIEPLMVKNAMDREREAVDSEFQGNMPSDGRRLGQLFKSIAKKNHPVSKFGAGNKQSLSKVQ